MVDSDNTDGSFEKGLSRKNFNVWNFLTQSPKLTIVLILLTNLLKKYNQKNTILIKYEFNLHAIRVFVNTNEILWIEIILLIKRNLSKNFIILIIEENIHQ